MFYFREEEKVNTYVIRYQLTIILAIIGDIKSIGLVLNFSLIVPNMFNNDSTHQKLQTLNFISGYRIILPFIP